MAAKKGKSLKHTIKYLAACKNSQLVSQIIPKSPDNVTKSNRNAALNAAQGGVCLNRNQKSVLSSNRQFINKLIQSGGGKAKRKSPTNTFPPGKVQRIPNLFRLLAIIIFSTSRVSIVLN